MTALFRLAFVCVNSFPHVSCFFFFFFFWGGGGGGGGGGNTVVRGTTVPYEAFQCKHYKLFAFRERFL